MMEAAGGRAGRTSVVPLPATMLGWPLLGATKKWAAGLGIQKIAPLTMVGDHRPSHPASVPP